MMMTRTLVLFSLLIGAALAFAGARWSVQQQRRATDAAFEKQRAQLLERDAARLLANAAPGAVKAEAAAAKKPPASDRRQEIEQAVAKIRGLKFAEPVKYQQLAQTEIKQTIERKLAEQFTEEEFAHGAIALAAMGLIKPNYPLRQAYVDLLGEQVAAFYDQHQHQLFMFENASLETLQNRIVLAHELTHALQDQNFGLGKLPLEIKTNDDRAMAASALVEGDATLVMSMYMLQNISLSDLGEGLAGMMSQNMEQLQKAPRYLRELLLFPYLKGQEFCTVIHQRGGFPAISEVFRDPPQSSSQILHPEKYLRSPRENPIVIDWPELEVMKQKPIADNVLGELGIQILISEWINDETGTAAAEGWRGDRYLVYDAGKAVIWKTKWSTAADAYQFFAAAHRYLAARYKLDPAGLAPGQDHFTVAAPRSLTLRYTGVDEVLLLDCATEEWASALTAQFAADLKPVPPK